MPRVVGVHATIVPRVVGVHATIVLRVVGVHATIVPRVVRVPWVRTRLSQREVRHGAVCPTPSEDVNVIQLRQSCQL